MSPKVNICIVHYNTPKLTKYLVKSINKFTPNSNIYIFDNSDKHPFVNEFNNVTIFDNTKGQIIDFDKWLENYPNRQTSTGKVNKYGSAKHSYSIQKCIELIDSDFILLDSDILLKKDISKIIDKQVLCSSDTEIFFRHKTKRCTPFICYINVDMMKEKKLSYFNDNYMYGLNKTSTSEHYDTGGYLYLLSQKYGLKKINNNDYIVHLRAGSWVEDAKKHHNYRPKLDEDGFINANKKLWWTNNKMANKIVIYTCITNGYDNIIEPKVNIPNVDFICFSDNIDLINSNVWKIRELPKGLEDLSDVKKQRHIKILPHRYLKEYDISIWVDGSITIKKDINQWINKTLTDEITCYIPKHPARKCIYKEAETCVKMKKDTLDVTKPQTDRYKKEGYPVNNGMVQTNIMLRKHNEPDCIALMEKWWDELYKGSHRDQLSFNYALWKTPQAKFMEIDKRTCNSEYFKWNPGHHNRKKKPTVRKTKVIESTNKRSTPNSITNTETNTPQSNESEKLLMAYKPSEASTVIKRPKPISPRKTTMIQRRIKPSSYLRNFLK